MVPFFAIPSTLALEVLTFMVSVYACLCFSALACVKGSIVNVDIRQKPESCKNQFARILAEIKI